MLLLGQKISAYKSDFDIESFIKCVETKLSTLELKDRVELIADELFNHLECDFKVGISYVLKILGPENEEETGMFKKFYWIMPLAKYVEKYGLNYYEVSIHAIEEITKRNTGEYTIRPFLELHEDKTLKVMKSWSLNHNKHIRRLSCEGLRPRLPWAKKLNSFIQDPTPILPIINNLKNDTCKYVQKSVANCINDILKDNLKIGQQLIGSWSTQELSKETKWIIKHALRNHIKKEDQWALQIIKKIN